jgi:hypothetical protein
VQHSTHPAPLAVLVCALAATTASCAQGGDGSGAGEGVDAGPSVGTDAAGATGPGAEGGAGGAEGGSDAWAQSACSDRALTYCGQLAQCAPFLAATQYGDDTACVATVTAICHDTVVAPGSGWTDGTLRACTGALGALSCGAFLRGKPAPRACRITGTTNPGDACVYDGQCRSGYCRVAEFARCGNCVTPGLTGSPCGRNADCDGDLMCASSGTCQPPAAPGAACDSPPRPCRPGLACTGGTCTPHGSAGATCDPREGAACDAEQGLFCDEQSSTCVALGVGQVGESCGARLAACYGGATCADGACANAPAVGDACEGDGAPGCGALGTCTGGICQPFTAADCP